MTKNLIQSGTHTQPRAESHTLRMKDVSVGWAILIWFLDVFLSWSDISVGRAFLTQSNISVEEDEDILGG